MEPTLQLVIPFKTAAELSIAYNTLSVDKEPKRNQVNKTLCCDQNNNLILNLKASEPRQLRLSVNSFIDHLILVQKTIAEFSLDSNTVETSD